MRFTHLQAKNSKKFQSQKAEIYAQDLVSLGLGSITLLFNFHQLFFKEVSFDKFRMGQIYSNTHPSTTKNSMNLQISQQKLPTRTFVLKLPCSYLSVPHIATSPACAAMGIALIVQYRRRSRLDLIPTESASFEGGEESSLPAWAEPSREADRTTVDLGGK